VSTSSTMYRTLTVAIPLSLRSGVQLAIIPWYTL